MVIQTALQTGFTEKPATKQTMDAENILLEQDNIIDVPLKPSDLSRYDEALYD